MNTHLPEARMAGEASGAQPAQVVVVAPGGRHTVWWVLSVLLAVIATALVTRNDHSAWLQTALAQSAGGNMVAPAGARGIYAFTGQLTAKSYGLFMMDVDSGTVWCYEMLRGPNNDVQMKLVAARSWIFDRYLEEFNVADPIPSAVRAMVQQRQAAERQAEAAGGSPATQSSP